MQPKKDKESPNRIPLTTAPKICNFFNKGWPPMIRYPAWYEFALVEDEARSTNEMANLHINNSPNNQIIRR
jgi:hypothetical protein